MEQIADAHAYVEMGRKKGSVVVVVAEEGADAGGVGGERLS